MDRQKTLHLIDGVDAVITARTWDEFSATTIDVLDRMAAIEDSEGLTAQRKSAAIYKVKHETEAAILKAHVQNWEEIRNMVSPAGADQLLTAINEFSQQAVTEGN